jgi:hypothetical protein
MALSLSKTGGKIRGVESGEEIEFSFRSVSLRKLEKSLDLLQDSAKDESLTRQQKRDNRDEAFGILIDNPKVLEEGSWHDIEKIFEAAIKFNQAGPDDAKKSE